jgi:hypothetical protein
MTKTESSRDIPVRKKQANSKRRKSAKHKNDDLQKKSRTRPFNGLVLSISTLNTSIPGEDSLTFNSVSQTIKSMGGEVLSQVGKRVQYMICTPSAVQKATQRVRKAYKKRIPIIDVVWLKVCAEEGRRVNVEDYRLDKEAGRAIQKRKEVKSPIEVQDVPPEEMPTNDAGWTEAQDLGCCCVCHENGTAKDCSWCKDLDCAKC